MDKEFSAEQNQTDRQADFVLFFEIDLVSFSCGWMDGWIRGRLVP